MDRLSYPQRLWRAFTRIFGWGWKSMEVTAFVVGAILLVNGLLYAFKIGGLAPAQVVCAMSWFISPLLATLDLVAPPISWLIRFSSSLWDVSVLVEVIAIFAGLLGMISGTILFVRELFRFHYTGG